MLSKQIEEPDIFHLNYFLTNLQNVQIKYSKQILKFQDSQ